MSPKRGAYAGDPIAAGGEPGDLAALQQVDSCRIGAAREAPSDVVVFGDSRARLVGRAEHRVAEVGRDVDDRAELLDLVGFQPLGVDAVEHVGLDAAHAVADVLQAVREVEHAALAEQDRVAEVVLEALPQLQRVLVDLGAFIPQIVRPDQRGIAGHVAAREPALLEHGDVGDAVVLHEVMGGRQAVAAAADDHDVVGPLGLRIAPEEVGMIGQVRTRCLWTHAALHRTVVGN